MEKKRWEESEKRRGEERRSEKRKSQRKEDAGAQKGRKVAMHRVFPMFWGSGGSKSRLAKAAGAEPSCQMRDEKLHAVVARSTFLGALLEVELAKKCTPLWREAHFQVKMLKAPHARTTFEWFCAAGARDSALAKCEEKRKGFVASPKDVGRRGTFEGDRKDAFSVAGAAQETCSSELLGGLGADFLRGVAFWSLRPSGLLRSF